MKKNTLKRLVVTTTLALLFAAPVQAQILTMDEEDNSRVAGDLDEFGRIPNQWVSYDQYNAVAPVGSGIVLLTALGTLYLIGKRRKED